MSYASAGWVPLATGFPPSLVTNADASQLEANQTPDAYNLSMTDEGYLVKGVIPTATTRVAKTYTIGAITYFWYFNRLWYFTGTQLVYGAPDYTAIYFKQGRGEVELPHDTNPILKILPLGINALAVMRASGTHIIRNADDQTGNFQATEFIQAAFISTATHAIEMDGVIYFSNTKGVFALAPTGEVSEITFNVRGSFTAAGVLTADYGRKHLIFGTTFAYDVQTKRWFRYDAVNTLSRYTTRTLTNKMAPFTVLELAFEVSKADDAEAYSIAMQVDCEGDDAAWDLADTLTVDMIPGEDGKQLHLYTLPAPKAARTFRMRITDLPTGLKIRSITARSEGYIFESRAN